MFEARKIRLMSAPLTDPHQVNSIIATAICDCRKDHPDQKIGPQEAKQIAKCIIEALAHAGLGIASSKGD